MATLTVFDVVVGVLTAGLVVAIGLEVRDRFGIHRPRRRNAPAPYVHRRPAPPPELEPVTVCGEWPINPGDRVRILVHVPEYAIEIGHGATCEAVWPGDDVVYRLKLDGRHGRDAVITFFEHELWQLEKV